MFFYTPVLEHFLITCEELEYKRTPIMNDIIYESAKILAKSDLDNVMLLQLIIDPYMYVNKRDKEKNKERHYITYRTTLL